MTDILEALDAARLTHLPVAYTAGRGWHLIADPQEIHRLVRLAQQADSEQLTAHQARPRDPVLIRAAIHDDLRHVIALLADALNQSNRRAFLAREKQAGRRLRVVA